ncbi:MAG: dienelactone hydrolase family protein [Bradyrhizobiaceae bacterium]|nr:dienelactone hydrolase family protein [Bradyrhizobiaceae bacterium]
MPKPISKRLVILLPRRKRRPAVLVIHSWWGLTASFRVFGRALADEGFVVGLADLFDGRTAADVRQATHLRRAPRKEPMYKTLIRNIDELRAVDGTHPAIGVVGFSMGGHWAVWLSQRPDLPIGATVLYYAARAGSFRGSRSSYLAHFAENDSWVSRASRRKMEAEIAKAGRSYTAFDYPGTAHWFAETDRRAEHAPDAAAVALERTIKYLKKTLREG